MVTKVTWIPKRCLHPSHNPPSHMIYPPGVYEHKCPGCGRITKITTIRPLWLWDPDLGPKF